MSCLTLAAVACRNAFRKRADGLGKPRRAQLERSELAIRGERSSGPQALQPGENRQRSNQVKKEFRLARRKVSRGGAGIWRLPLTVSAEGFAAWDRLLEVRSEVPVRVCRGARMAPVNTKVEVTDAATLLIRRKTGTIYSLSGRRCANMKPRNRPIFLTR